MHKPKKIDVKETIIKEKDPSVIKEMMEEEKEIVQERKIEKKKERANWWKRKTKSQKTNFILSCFVFVLALLVLFIYIFARQLFGDAIGDTLFGKDIENGFVYFTKVAPIEKWIATAVTIAIGFVVAFILNLIIKISTFESKKAKTVGSLIRSLAKYIIVLIGAGKILTIWGVDVASVLAGIGVITLIVGLGCQSLIQDVISGLFIVFDDFYDVGDIVIIDGFRGRISEIGLKSTKILDWGGNEKAINNSSITTVTNLSRGPSMIFITINISYREDVERVEGIIANALPRIKSKIPAITDGPYYKGISGFNNFGVELAFLCFSDENDRFQVTRDLNREIYLELAKENVLIPFQQITINQPLKEEAFQKANKEQKEEAEKITKSNRPKKAAPKKKTFAEKTKDVFFKTASGE